MGIYYLDDILTAAALSSYKKFNTDFAKNIQMLAGQDYKYLWEEEIGENWASVVDNDCWIAMLSPHIPFAIVSDEKLKQRIYQLFPFVEIMKIADFQNDKVVLNPNICRLTIDASLKIDDKPMSLQDFYYSTV